MVTPAATHLRARPAPPSVLAAFGSAWRTPRLTVRQLVRSDAATFVILVAWLSGVLEMLQTSAMRASMPPHWGPYAVLLAVFMGPLLAFAYFELAGQVAGTVGRLLGGAADVSDTRVALACGMIPELAALPLWPPVLAFYGLELFTTERPPTPTGLWVFASAQAALWLWSLALRVTCLAEVNGFSIARALLCVLLSWLAGVVILVVALVGLVALISK
jgi:hypothetical protein